MLVSKKEIIEGVKKACNVFGGKIILETNNLIVCDFGEKTKGGITATFEDEKPLGITAELLYDDAIVLASVGKPFGIRCKKAKCFFLSENREENFSIEKVGDRIEIFNPSLRVILPFNE